MEKEVFELWKEISPSSAYTAGLKQYAGQLWIPSHTNIKKALKRIEELEKNAGPITKKFLTATKRTIITEEPQHAPADILNTFYTHLVIEGINQKHILTLAEQALNYLAVQEYMHEKNWPIEFQIFTSQGCDGANSIIETIKKKVNNETKQALTALQKRLTNWKEKTTKLKLKRNDYKEIYPILKKHSKGLGRKNDYRQTIKDLYDYTETPEQIEQQALNWIEQELPEFKKTIQKLAKKYKCKPTVEEIDKALKKAQYVAPNKILKTIAQVRKVLQPLANKEWVEITPKYDVRLTETPPYLVPFLPTAAMQPFNTLTKPFSIYFATIDTKASPSTNLPDIAQTTIHEEYGHCVNYMNSYTGYIEKPKLLEILGTTLDIPITEGISFHREKEALKTFNRLLTKGAQDLIEKNVIKEIEKHVKFEDFVDGIHFIVQQWRIIRFLRAISDVRINLEKQTFPEFIEWAHKKTGLSKKMIYDQTIHFQERPGYAPCYSIFGQTLAKLQQKTPNTKEFNTYAASIGFPARSIYEAKLKKKFKL